MIENGVRLQHTTPVGLRYGRAEFDAHNHTRATGTLVSKTWPNKGLRLARSPARTLQLRALPPQATNGFLSALRGGRYVCPDDRRVDGEDPRDR